MLRSFARAIGKYFRPFSLLRRELSFPNSILDDDLCRRAGLAALDITKQTHYYSRPLELPIDNHHGACHRTTPPPWRPHAGRARRRPRPGEERRRPQEHVPRDAARQRRLQRPNRPLHLALVRNDNVDRSSGRRSGPDTQQIRRLANDWQNLLHLRSRALRTLQHRDVPASVLVS